jgi:Do/DeqQ family serine protease
MRKYGLVVVCSFVSAVLAIFLYKLVEEPKTVIYRPNAAPTLTSSNFGGQTSNSATVHRPFISSSPNDFTKAADAVAPVVVNINAIDNRRFWESSQNSTGSGVIISPDGYIVTNNHVIEDGDKFEVTLGDKSEYAAKLVGSDPSTDLALLKIEHEVEVPHLPFGNSDSLRVGEWVLAVGNPFNLTTTVTAGIVSAKGRTIDILQGKHTIESFIQTDAAINPGNSGGALVNTNGELVGINTAIITRTGRYEGYSFAVPVNLVSKVINDLKDYGVVQRGLLGIDMMEVNSSIAEKFGLEEIKGVYINRVEPGSGADEAGLRDEDIILKVNGGEVGSAPSFSEFIGMQRPGNTLTIEFLRNGVLKKVDVLLRNENNTTEFVTLDVDEFDILQDIGFELRELSADEKLRLNIQGVMVKSVYKGSPIARTNMDPGFIITKVNDKLAENIEEVVDLINEAEDKVMLEGQYEHFSGDYFYAFKK